MKKNQNKSEAMLTNYSEFWLASITEVAAGAALI